MNNFSIPTVTVNHALLNKKVQPQQNAVSVPPKVEMGKNLPTLAIPGFNDHHVILFGRKPAPATQGADAPKKYESLDSIEQNGINIYKNVSPAVVRVNVKSSQIVMNPETGEKMEIPQGGSGSGSILDKEGHVVTNFHVVSGADEIKIELEKGKSVPAKLIGSDPSTDISLLKIDMPKAELAKLPTVKLGDSNSAIPGQRTFAIGNPFSLYRTMTQGIVSALDRNIISPGGRITKGVIQTDASINPGNSGGALINAKGEQIGINSQIFTTSGSSAGLGMAIPINTAKQIIADLKTTGRVIRPYLGIKGGIPLEAMHPQLKQMFKLDKLESGVILQQVAEDGPASKAGLKGGQLMIQTNEGDAMVIGGDIITKVNGQPVSNMTALFELLDENKIGDKLDIEYVSHNVKPDPETQSVKASISKPKTVGVIIGETPAPENPAKVEFMESMPKPLEDDPLRDFNLK
jgi:S1-C subfamily serine protease